MLVETPPAPLASTFFFQTLDQAYQWAEEHVQIRTVQVSRVWDDLFRSARPKGRYARYLQLLGVERKAEKICKSLVPGKWRVEADTVDGVVRFETYYDRFLPYAVAMMECEDGFECKGIEYDSIVAINKTVQGFNDLGMSSRIEAADADLFSEIYSASMAVKSPDLIFDEVYRPCIVFVALQKPSLIARKFNYDHNHGLIQHIRHVCERMGRECPRFRWPKSRLTPA